MDIIRNTNCMMRAKYAGRDRRFTAKFSENGHNVLVVVP